jgi:hypothetical protein
MLPIYASATGRKSIPRHIEIGHLQRFARRHRLPLRLAALVAELAGINAGAR